MNGVQAREYIRQHHPQATIHEIVRWINDGQHDFCNRTQIFKAAYTDSSAAGQRFYTLPDNTIKIIKVEIDDVQIPRLQGDPGIEDDELSSTNPLAVPSDTYNERYFYESLGRLGIVEKIGVSSKAIERDDKTTNYQSISEDDLEIRIYSISSPADLTYSNYDDSNILNGVHGGYENTIINYAIAQGYLSPISLNPELFQVFEAQYEKVLREAKKVSRSRYIDIGRIVPNDF